jgi:serine/threonine-protein kinase 40
LEDSDKEGQDDRQGKMLMHTEYSLLSLLHNQPGVVHHHGLFKVCTILHKVSIATIITYNILEGWKVLKYS